ncbi:Yip1 family protein [Roseibacterium sp. SDUM158017]|uniref:Yip1 family protein n=1 Tax=Roseicyclus salinarum TaxID=3036773 RepID=UPI0024154960|nr:Yip1 family protein [Roseibacterium sp. SDUM158017]MDG4648897.1 Yip1 family protein [Roseibacterium sp. SDUM158017]
MTDIGTLRHLLRLARDTVANPREGATTVLSFAPQRQALWLMFALVVVTSMMMGEIVALLTTMPADGPMTGPFVQSPLALGLVQAGFLFLMIHAIHHIGRFFGGTGSLEEAALLVIWLQFIFICVQVVQIVAIVIVPPVAGLVTILAIGLFFWLLVNFIAVLHGFTSLGLVFVVTLLAGFGLLVFLSMVLASLGVAVPTA